MNDEAFSELVESLRQGGRALRGEEEPLRQYGFDDPDVRGIRKRLGLSQTRFAQVIGISVAMLGNWEQGRGRPEGAPRVLLQVAARNPAAIADTLRAPAGIS